MMKENRIVVKAPFKERWEAFKKAYYNWARCNPYKEYPYPRYEDFRQEEFDVQKLPEHFIDKVHYYDEVYRMATIKHREALRRRKINIKAKKIRLRYELKQAFFNLF